MSDMINKMTESDLRATVLSIRSFVMRMVFCATAPLLGYVNDFFSLQAAFMSATLLGAAAVVVGLVRLHGAMKAERE